MNRILLILLVICFAACAKSDSDNRVVFPEPESLAWFTAKKTEYTPCTCLIEARQGIYKNQPVIEFRVIDPVCNGINTVYKSTGEVWFSSADQDAYDDYMDEVNTLKTIWTCR